MGNRGIKNFLSDYFSQLTAAFHCVDPEKIENACALVRSTNNNGGKIIILGNGGSAAIASHITVDLNKAAGIEAINFNDPAMITCFGNDFGYENWVKEAIKIHCNPNDTVLLISSSGESLNIINGMVEAKLITRSTVSFTGFKKNNTFSKPNS